MAESSLPSLILGPDIEPAIPFFYLFISVVHVIYYKAAKVIRDKYHVEDDVLADDSYSPSTTRTFRETIKEYDGISVICFRFLRAASCTALVYLQLSKPLDLYNSDRKILSASLYMYATVLASRTIFATTAWRDFYARQLSQLLLVDYVVYSHLNLWPLCKVGGYPYDREDHWTFWPIAIFLTIAAVIVPVLSPRPFRPSKNRTVPGVEDTASLFSLYTFSYSTRVLFHAYRTPKVSVDDLPHISDKRRAENMACKLKYLDPLLVGRKQNFLWGMIRAFRWSYLLLFALTVSNAVTSFLGATGMRNLLIYVESGEYAHGVKPWVWVILLAFGPLFSGMFFTHFMSISTRQVVSAESTITQLVFEHSLRIRMRGETFEKDKKQPQDIKQLPKSDASSVASAAVSSSSHETAPSSSESTVVDHLNAEGSAIKDDISVDLDAEGEGEESELLLEEAEESAIVENEKPKTSHLIGKINSLITTDLRDAMYLQNMLNLPGAVIQVLIAMAFLYDLLGWSALVGLASMFVFIPITAMIGKLLLKANKEKKTLTDKRIQTVSESLSVLRMVKLFAWEPFIIKRLSDAREAEVKKLRNARLLDIANSLVSEFLPLVVKIVVFAIYTLVMKKELTASVIFSSLMVFQILEVKMRYVFWRIPEILRSMVTMKRYTDFFNTMELLPSALEEQDTETRDVPLSPPPREGDQIGFNNCSFSWDPSDAQPQKGGRKFKLLFGKDVVFQRGCINLILGPTASGKTSVLMALLGEMYYNPSGPDAWYSLPRDGGIAYAAQESWVLNETVKDNILFGQSFDAERYNKVIQSCALEQDLALWEAGDMTEVGEKGLTLSGGQKARVTLARALYSRASIVLLDDVLAALDVHTAKHVVNEALRGELTRHRTIILVTHNIALTAPIAEHVILLGRNGRVLKHGPASDVLKSSPKLRTKLEGQKEITTDEGISLKDTSKNDRMKPQESAVAGKLVVAEEKAMGRLEFAAIGLFMRSYGGIVIWSISCLLISFSILSSIAQPWFVGIWSSQYEKYDPSEVRVAWYFSIYATITILGTIIDGSNRIFTTFRSAVASETIHYELIESILRAPIRWLDVTPVGRILTRCTQDIGTIDSTFPYMFTGFFYLLIQNLSLFFVTIIQAGLYALVPGSILAIVGGYMSSVYLKGQINVKREMTVKKAPVMSQLGVALAGLQSIRAYGAKQFFRRELNRRIDEYVRASLAFYDLNRWVSARLDFLGAIFACAVASYLVYGSNMPAGSIGFTMSVVLSFAQSILYVVRIYNFVESDSNSLERILGYLRIEHEPPMMEGTKPPAYWPASGDLRVEGLTAKYSDESPEVLKNLSFEIKSGERVGIVGRTGAGKSTIALALLRAIKTYGKVYYDGLPTDELSLHALRSKITLIPQQPELIQGSLRENLDPFGEHDDAFLNHALNASQLHDVKDLSVGINHGGEAQSNDDGQSSKRSISLDTMVEAGGTNFSMGQRQIIALARAIVRKSKLLILDEATAAIDYATDQAIQKTLRTEFGRDTTMITIAHRLQTIMDYDKIMVLDKGELIEYDTPRSLLAKTGGLFRALVDESEDRDTLRSMAS